MVLTILTFEQQEAPNYVCTNSLNAIKNDPNLLETPVHAVKNSFRKVC